MLRAGEEEVTAGHPELESYDYDLVVIGGGSGGLAASKVTTALCRIQLLTAAHVLVDTRVLTVKPVYKLSNVPDDVKLTTNTLVTPFMLTFKA